MTMGRCIHYMCEDFFTNLNGGEKYMSNVIIKTIVGGFLGVLIGVVLINPIATAIAAAVAGGNLTGTDTVLIQLITTIFIISIMMVAVNMM